MVEINEKQLFSFIQKAKETGSIRIGANEVTKAVERGQAKLVLGANDVSPAEIVAHFPGLCKEMGVFYYVLGTKAEIGSAAGVKSTTVVAVLDAGSAKKELDAFLKELEEEKKGAEKKEEKKEEVSEKKEEKKPKKEKKEEKVEEVPAEEKSEESAEEEPVTI